MSATIKGKVVKKTKPKKKTSTRKRQYRNTAKKPAAELNLKDLQSLQTRNEILDAAEGLFAHRGLYGVTVRNIAEKAGVDTALVHYYFGTKDQVFEAVFERRTVTINEARLKSMDLYEAEAGSAITVEGAVRAFLGPILDNDQQNDAGWRSWSALVALANNSKEWGGEMMSRYFDKVIHRFIDLLRKAMPGAQDEDLYWAYQMFSGSLMVIQASTGRIELLSGGKCSSDDVDAFAERLIAHATAGFEALCQK